MPKHTAGSLFVDEKITTMQIMIRLSRARTVAQILHRLGDYRWFGSNAKHSALALQSNPHLSDR